MVRMTNNVEVFNRNFRNNISTALNEMGRFGNNKLNEHAAIDTGYMVSRNNYFVHANHVDIGNYGCDYAIYQEYGTYKMPAHPFVRPAALNYQGHYRTIARIALSRGMR